VILKFLKFHVIAVFLGLSSLMINTTESSAATIGEFKVRVTFAEERFTCFYELPDAICARTPKPESVFKEWTAPSIGSLSVSAVQPQGLVGGLTFDGFIFNGGGSVDYFGGGWTSGLLAAGLPANRVFTWDGSSGSLWFTNDADPYFLTSNITFENITPVPLPAGVVFMLTGLLAVFIGARRSKA
jgi:hypothetical protein